ncbi:Glycerol-3-phosphate acyltransferase [Sphingomonas antarctica]|uniref:glycerol-3-phosphate 1-O-acyltransferase PlsY n=1 Tax=Sphingomonas antarctica TaxID=2040274 RepID=UPI0039EAFF33
MQGWHEALWLWPAGALVLGYLLGSIPFGLILTRLSGGGDIRQQGSGNIGATNVLRTGRKGVALATLLLDGGKGALAYFLGEQIGPGLGMHAAAGAFFGHLYPVWLGFKGGKGVATMLGISLAMLWPTGLAFALVWVAVFALFRWSSLAGMFAASAVPVTAAILGRFDVTLLTLAFALVLIWKHRENIDRLLSGEEPHFGRSAA